MTLEPLRIHRRWLILLGCGLALMAAGPYLAQSGMDVAQRQADDLATERAQLQEAAARFDADMQLAQSAEAPMSEEEIDRLLAPVDRLRVVAGLERQAASARFAHFTYTLAPEKKAPIDAIDATAMADSELTLSADVPLDIDAFAFLQNAGSLLPGRVRLRQLNMTRLASDAPLSLANIHMEAVLDWLSNGAAKEKAAVP